MPEFFAHVTIMFLPLSGRVSYGCMCGVCFLTFVVYRVFFLFSLTLYFVHFTVQVILVWQDLVSVIFLCVFFQWIYSFTSVFLAFPVSVLIFECGMRSGLSLFWMVSIPSSTFGKTVPSHQRSWQSVWSHDTGNTFSSGLYSLLWSVYFSAGTDLFWMQ